MKIFVFLFFISFTWNAFANSDCAYRDFTAELGEPRDQDNMAWCFAEAAADLVTQQVHFRVSAAALLVDFLAAPTPELWRRHDARIQTYLKIHPNLLRDIRLSRGQDEELQGKNLLETLHLVEQNRILNLTRQGISGKNGLVNVGGDVDLAILLANIGQLCTEEETPTNSKYVRRLLAQADQIVREAEEKSRTCLGGRAADPASQVNSYSGYYVLETYKKLLHQSCKAKPYVPLVPHHVGLQSVSELRSLSGISQKSGDRLQNSVIERLNDILDHRRAVAINYSAYLVLKKDAGDPDVDGDHASVIAGRQKIGERCYFKLRNSWGTDCGLLEPFKSRCVGGYTMVTAEELKRGMINGLDYID